MERDRSSYINTNRIPPFNHSLCEASLVFCHVVQPFSLEPLHPCLSLDAYLQP